MRASRSPSRLWALSDCCQYSTRQRSLMQLFGDSRQGKQTPPSLPAPGNFQAAPLDQLTSYGWFPYAVNVVELDFPDITAAAAVIAFNDEQWGGIPRGNGASAVAAGKDGSVYKLDSTGVSGTDPALYRWNSTASTWIPVILSGFAVATGVRVAVDFTGILGGQLQRSISKQVSTGQWTPVPGLSAKDIAIGYNGQAWAIGKDGRVYKYDAPHGNWNPFSISAGKVPFHIASDAEGNLLLVNTDGTMEQFSGTTPVLFNQPFAATSVGFGGSQFGRPVRMHKEGRGCGPNSRDRTGSATGIPGRM